MGVEREGTIKYDDCREIIEIKDDSILKFFKDFTCSYSKTKTGKIMSGNCVNIKTTSENQCLRAYIYYVEPEIKCPDEVNGYLGYDGECHCNTGYSFIENTKKCESFFSLTPKGIPPLR
ncbi:MAG: hypothetical protein ABIC82_06940 [bacterium]